MVGFSWSRKRKTLSWPESDAPEFLCVAFSAVSRRRLKMCKKGKQGVGSSSDIYTYHYLGCDIGGAKELGVIYFPTNWGAKEPQNLPNHRVVIYIHPGKLTCHNVPFEKGLFQ